jgi:hypothetical protein
VRPESCNQGCGRKVRPFNARAKDAARVTAGLPAVSSAAEPILRGRLIALGFECAGVCEDCARAIVATVESLPPGAFVSSLKGES